MHLLILPSTNPSVPFRSFTYTERHLQCLWSDFRLRPKQLSTTQGESVEVEHPGNWNLEAGPDFHHAVLRIGRERRRICGDLEIHIHSENWNHHGHRNDPRYENVHFHIVYFQGPEIPGLIQIPLQKILDATPQFSFENIDLSAYPYHIATGDFPFKNMPPEEKTELLESAGEERLRLKTERFARIMQTKEPNQLLWEELLAALGYKNNKIPFRKMAECLPLDRLQSLTRSPEETYALLLGLSGLLPTNPSADWDVKTHEFIRKLWDFWWKQPDELHEAALQKSEWTLHGIRPINHPIRRLMAAAYYAGRIPEIATAPSKLTNFPDNFWTHHLTWKSACPATTVVGSSRANAIVTNILIPFQAVTHPPAPPLEKLPAEPMNGIIRQAAYALFGPDHPPKIYRSTLARQGLIQIFYDYLIPHRLHALREKFQG